MLYASAGITVQVGKGNIFQLQPLNYKNKIVKSLKK